MGCFFVCVHKDELVSTPVAFKSQVNGSVMLCVRRVKRKGRMSAGPEAVLRFCSSVEIFVISEKNFPNTFSVPG